jgi:hypothetical protein
VLTVDVHTHFLLEAMDQRGIDHAVLPAARQLFMYWADASEAAGFCRALNDELAAFAAGPLAGQLAGTGISGAGRIAGGNANDPFGLGLPGALPS